MKDRANPVQRLSQLKAGMKAVIVDHEQTELKERLLEMGCIPGEPVWIEMVAPMGDPLAIKIAGYYLSLRKQDAENIRVSLAPEPLEEAPMASAAP